MTLTHAGGIVFKVVNGTKLFLLITSSGDSSQWVLPKGHIEEGETPEFAAIREVIEEAGMLAMPLSIVGEQAYRKGFKTIRVRFYLMKFIQEVAPSTENRKQQWLPKEEAVQRLSFEETKKLFAHIS